MVEFQINNDASKELMYNKLIKLIQVHAHNRCLYEYACPHKICNICGINILLQLPSALPRKHSTRNNRTFRTLSLTVDRLSPQWAAIIIVVNTSHAELGWGLQIKFPPFCYFSSFVNCQNTL